MRKATTSGNRVGAGASRAGDGERGKTREGGEREKERERRPQNARGKRELKVSPLSAHI